MTEEKKQICWGCFDETKVVIKDGLCKDCIDMDKYCWNCLDKTKAINVWLEDGLCEECSKKMNKQDKTGRCSWCGQPLLFCKCD